MIEEINAVKSDLSSRLESKPEGYSTVEEVAHQCGILPAQAKKLLALAVRKGTVEAKAYNAKVVGSKVVKTAVYRAKAVKVESKDASREG